MWLDAIRGLLQFLSTNAGLGAGFGIVALTLLLRTTLLPITWSNGYRACVRQKRMVKLQPELQRNKEKFTHEPRRYAEETMALYRKNGISPIDGRGLLGALVQLPIFLGMFQALKDAGIGVRFLWIRDLSKSDVLLALLAGLTTAMMMAVNPDLPESMRLFLIVVPSIFAILAAIKFCSALAVYWAASNCFSALQTIALHRVIAQRIKSGAVKI
jgi:YidC/Oxa1 family membrane protein insertase